MLENESFETNKLLKKTNEKQTLSIKFVCFIFLLGLTSTKIHQRNSKVKYNSEY